MEKQPKTTLVNDEGHLFLWRVISCVLVLTLATCLPAAYALNVAFSENEKSIPSSSPSGNAPFSIRVTAWNEEGLDDPVTGLADFAVYFEKSDVTDYFCNHVALSTPVGFAPNQAIQATLNVPQGILSKGLYWLHIAVRDRQGFVYTDTMTLVVGSVYPVWAASGNAAHLRSLVEDATNTLIYVPPGTYVFSDSSILRLKDGQTLWGAGSDKVIFDGSLLKTSGLSPVLVMGKGVRLHGITVINTATGSGISASGDVEAAVNDVISRGNAGGGIVAYNGARIFLANSHFSKNAYDGATAGCGGQIKAIMSSAAENGFDGFGAEQTAELITDFTMANNNGGVGFGLFTESRGTINRSMARSNGKAGVHCGPGTLLSYLTYTFIVTNGADGLGVLGPNAIVENMISNLIMGNRSGVTLLQGAKISCYKWNSVHSNQQTDFYADESSSLTVCN